MLDELKMIFEELIGHVRDVGAHRSRAEPGLNPDKKVEAAGLTTLSWGAWAFPGSAHTTSG